MGLLSELRIRAYRVLFPAFGVSAVLYFAYHGISGDRGLLAWRKLEKEVRSTQFLLVLRPPGSSERLVGIPA